MSPAAFQDAVVTLLEGFQKVHVEAPFSRTRECTAYKAQRVYTADDDLDVSFFVEVRFFDEKSR